MRHRSELALSRTGFLGATPPRGGVAFPSKIILLFFAANVNYNFNIPPSSYDWALKLYPYLYHLCHTCYSKNLDVEAGPGAKADDPDDVPSVQGVGWPGPHEAAAAVAHAGVLPRA